MAEDVRETVERVASVVRSSRLPLHDEKALQAALADRLNEAGIAHDRERHLSPVHVVDFLVDGVAVECKLRGASKRAIYRQVRRYADSDEVRAVLLVTNTAMGLPAEIKGCPTYVVSLGEAWL